MRAGGGNPAFDRKEVAMRRGRPPAGLGHVDQLDGSEESKLRLRTILETLSGECTIAEACARLGVGEARFHQLRQAALESALGGLAPGRAGRPAQAEESEPSEIDALKRKVNDLEIDLQAARVRTEIALTMPHLLQDSGVGKKKTPQAKAGRSSRRKRRRRR